MAGRRRTTVHTVAGGGDATGIVPGALFCELEKTRSYFQLLEALIQRCGLPIALYADRHAVFKNTPSSDSAAAPTQFSRAMEELGIQLIFARSPQAKGRVGRTAGTFQDRLVTELRLVGAITIDDANRVLKDFLSRFNNRFKVPAQESEAAHRPVDGLHLEMVLCFKYRRRVARDNTVRYRRRTLRLLPGTDRTSYAGTVVDVLERLDGRLEVQHQGQDITSQEAPPRPSILRDLAGRPGHTVAPYLSTIENAIRKITSTSHVTSTCEIPKDNLVDRLCESRQPLLVLLESKKDIHAIEQAIENGFLNVRLLGTKGGTELVVSIKESKLVHRSNRSSKSTILKFLACLVLNYENIYCLAEINLNDFTGYGHFQRYDPTNERT